MFTAKVIVYDSVNLDLPDKAVIFYLAFLRKPSEKDVLDKLKDRISNEVIVTSTVMYGEFLGLPREVTISKIESAHINYERR